MVHSPEERFLELRQYAALHRAFCELADRHLWETRQMAHRG